MRDFGQWFIELFNTSVWLMTSTIIALALSAVSAIRGESPYVTVILFIIGLVVFFLANFFAWRKEHRARVKAEQDSEKSLRERQQAEQKLAALSYDPQLSGTIDQLVTGDSPELNGMQIFILLSIVNTGMPSAVQGYRLSIESGMGRMTNIPPTSFPDGFKLYTHDDKVIAEFQRGDAIYEKTVAPIVQGGIQRGWLRYILPGFHAVQLQVQGTIWNVEFMDILNRKYVASYTFTGQRSEGPMYYPGAEQPFARIVEPPPSSEKDSARNDELV